MTCVYFLILFGLSCLSFSCEGQVLRPLGGNNLIVLNGSNVTIAWRLDPPGLSTTNVIRTWSFKSSSGNDEILAEIGRAGTLTTSTKLYEVEIEEPATLVLKNVNASYNGKYVFTFFSTFANISVVNVTIAAKPSVTISCSDLTTVNEGDDLTCVCGDEDGNPPANLTWFDKDGVQIGNTNYGKNILTLTNVNKQHSGRRYKCKGQSYILTDEKSFEVKVRLNFKPNKTDVSFTMTPAVVGESVSVMCSSNGLPEPSYTIMHNDTNTVSNQTTYIINKVESSDAGTYKCIATNKLGSDSDSKNLTVEKVSPPTSPSSSHKITTTMSGNKTDKASSNDTSCGIEWYIVVVILVSGIIIGLLLAYIVWCFHRRWQVRKRKLKRNNEAQTTEADTTYQELDLTKMNKEENYQSLRVNAASNNAGNDDDSTYTELNKTRDVENNYQSLT